MRSVNVVDKADEEESPINFCHERPQFNRASSTSVRCEITQKPLKVYSICIVLIVRLLTFDKKNSRITFTTKLSYPFRDVLISARASRWCKILQQRHKYKITAVNYFVWNFKLETRRVVDKNRAKNFCAPKNQLFVFAESFQLLCSNESRFLFCFTASVFHPRLWQMNGAVW